jgi:hypothetical protein
MKQDEPKLNFNSVQLNIVTFVDVNMALTNRSVDKSVHMMDSSFSSANQGSSFLQTNCKQGQTLNWIIYPLDNNRRVDGSWPLSVRISNIVFLNDIALAVTSLTMNQLKIYGSPDRIRSFYTPVYYYWAGIVPVKLSPGIYQYRLVLELETEKKGEFLYLNLDTPSLNVTR